MTFLFFQSKQKAEKNRQRVAESFSKASHAQRAEAAQARKEEKMRAEKERIMKEDDPEKQKRLEVDFCDMYSVPRACEKRSDKTYGQISHPF